LQLKRKKIGFFNLYTNNKNGIGVNINGKTFIYLNINYFLNKFDLFFENKQIYNKTKQQLTSFFQTLLKKPAFI